MREREVDRLLCDRRCTAGWEVKKDRCRTSMNHDLNSMRYPDLSAGDIRQRRRIADRNARVVDAAHTWGVPPHSRAPIPYYLKKSSLSFLYISRGGVRWVFTIGHEASQPAEGEQEATRVDREAGQARVVGETDKTEVGGQARWWAGVGSKARWQGWVVM